MGASSSLLDETKANYIKGRAEAELKNFIPHYRQQALQARVQLLQEEAEPRREGRGQLLTPKEMRGSEELLYQNSVNCHDDSRKWKERFVVVRGNHTLELHDTLESFSRGTPARHSQSLTGGEATTSEDTYSALLDRAFPDPNGVKEETQSVVPAGWFPVFLCLPYSPDIFFCFRQEEQQAHFLSILNTCIRHQNLGWREGPRGEVLALQRALLFYRQEKNHYEGWELELGSDLQVLCNLVMEETAPHPSRLDLLPRLRGRRRLWTAVVQAAYQLVQEQLGAGLEALKEECRQTASANQTLIRSDLDQILASRALLTGQAVRVCVCSSGACVQHQCGPLPAVPPGGGEGGASGGAYWPCGTTWRLSSTPPPLSSTLPSPPPLQVVSPLFSASLEQCYQPVEQLREKLLDLHQRFRYSNCQRLIHTTQIDMQQLMESAVHTFELLVQSEPPAQWSSTVEKIKLRVLKLYDHDSRLVLKRILKEALTDITLPVLRRNLAPSCKPELQKFEQFIFADYSQLIQVENVYEDLLLCLITKENRQGDAGSSQ
ncbi:LOW QUALITY PROTEIN: protein Niban 1-like [Hypomesus transpacificus]|uniref:LOW QUALITY PROTEIN: protein Niban 1-like n=1 Tax=Hypomesus transpacificus TaxID=137520 RepID=UPI001F071D11|nr:LOW QUALITY PROTEIN: protein Niban 1-like [Hypomesus transpacificus]